MKTKRIAPVHPGFYLKELLDELGLSQSGLTKAIGVPAMRVNHIVKGKRPVTAETALRLGLFFGQTPQYWLNLQSRYSTDCATDSIGERLRHEIAPLQAA
ncbi:MAG: HigA family addiction module antidote protein [Gammaproteobacteria bacterium]|nr:HigA family addiction module antidote protein [Gammaproteobacteria bacterium]